MYSPLVKYVIINEIGEEAITISEDKEILVYDLNTQVCVQNIYKKKMMIGPRTISACCFNQWRQALYVATNQLGKFEHMVGDQI